MREQQPQEGALLRTGELDPLPPDADLQRPEDPELDVARTCHAHPFRP
jgi:hypothetical protein